MYLAPDKFSEAMGIGLRAAQAAFQKAATGQPWRGFELPVVAVPGNQGGAGGKVWVLALDRCPEPLKTQLGIVEDGVQGRLNNNAPADWQWDEQGFRARLIKPILATAKRSPERADAFRSVAAKTHQRRGKPVTLSQSTLRQWVNAAEAKGHMALMPGARADKGKQRVLVTRAWDDGIDLAFDARAKIANRVQMKARSRAFNDGTSNRSNLRLAQVDLGDMCLAAGSKLPRQDLATLCKLNVKWAERVGLDRYRLGYLRQKDHKHYQDHVVGRVKHSLTDMPMALVLGDVHYADILVSEKGETVRLRLIAWLDASSLYAWVTPVLLSKGQGIVQADVAEALAHLVMCDHGGIPEHLYLDNGGEYSALAGAMSRLAYLSDREFGLTLAKPYSPTSKGAIEGLFHVLQGIFAGLPGYIGGQRDNKKSANKGKVVAPYSKGLDQLIEDVQACVAIYNSREQGPNSRLAGFSPKEVLQMKIAATGYAARQPSEDVFDLIFSKSEVRTVSQSGITISGRVYRGDCLHSMAPKEKVQVLVPLRKDRGIAWAVMPDGRPKLLREEPIFVYGDRAGARYQAELEAASNRVVRELARDIDPNVSTFEDQKRAADMTPPRSNPPERWTGEGAIDKTGLLRAPVTEAEDRAREDAETRAEIEEFLAFSRPERREAGGGNRQTSLDAT